MTAEEYFGKWIRCIDKSELTDIMHALSKVPSILLCPDRKDIFRAFELCKYDDCKVVMIGQDPYPQKGIATGILFGNSNDIIEDDISPSLRIIKDCVINLDIPHNIINFDNSLESWAEQGILMLNSALTCKVNEIGSHVMLWRSFIAKFLRSLSFNRSGLLYVLFGKQAQTLKPYIDKRHNTIIEVEHPSYYARINKDMPHIFEDIDKFLIDNYGETIQWFTEE